MKEEKKSHGIQLLLRAVVKDSEGKVLSDTGKKLSKSYLIQFLEFIYAMGEGVLYNATDVDGAETVFYWSSACRNFTYVGAPINTSTYGIVIGTGDTAETNEDYQLEVQLTEGVGAGNITHGAVVIEATAVVGANVDLELKRSFTNSTGSAITVKEAGLYSNMQGLEFFCLIRDVLAASVDVPDSCSVTVYYTLRTTV